MGCLLRLRHGFTSPRFLREPGRLLGTRRLPCGVQLETRTAALPGLFGPADPEGIRARFRRRLAQIDRTWSEARPTWHFHSGERSVNRCWRAAARQIEGKQCDTEQKSERRLAR